MEVNAIPQIQRRECVERKSKKEVHGGRFREHWYGAELRKARDTYYEGDFSTSVEASLMCI